MQNILSKAIRLFRREVLREPFLLEAKRWFRDNGDNALRLNYPLNSQSVVWDLGGYHGDFAEKIYHKYTCHIFIFEPLPIYYDKCTARFLGLDKVRCFKFGLSDKSEFLQISDEGDASSFLRSNGIGQQAELRSVAEVFRELGVDSIDLLKINIEGGEFDVLPALINSGLVNKFRHIQIQFHNFIPDADIKRSLIRKSLAKTHNEMWCYPFIWESWALKYEATPKTSDHSEQTGR
jgi:FkbM family methyltransferase